MQCGPVMSFWELLWRSHIFMPMAEDIYKLRLLDQEDEQSMKDQQQSGRQVSQCRTGIARKVCARYDIVACSE